MQLRLKGEEVGEGTQDDPGLLMSIMEARETIENTKDIAELNKFATVFRKQEESCIQASPPACKVLIAVNQLYFHNI